MTFGKAMKKYLQLNTAKRKLTIINLVGRGLIFKVNIKDHSKLIK